MEQEKDLEVTAKKKNKWLKVSVITLVVLLVVLLGASYGLASYVVTGHPQTLDEAMKWQQERYDTTFFTEGDVSDYIVKGYEDYELHTYLLKNENSDGKYVIISHGYTDNHIGSLKYARIYYNLGFNCIIYDLRGHGENEKHITTYSYLESKDLVKVVEDTRNRYDDIKLLGLHGESLGAATTAASMQYKPEVDFAVCDCGFAEMFNLLSGSGYGAPKAAVKLADIGLHLFYGLSLDDMRPVDALKDNTVPMMFIHGEWDSLISYDNSERMAEATKGESEVHIVPKAEHAESVFTDYDSYVEYVKEFVEKVQDNEN